MPKTLRFGTRPLPLSPPFDALLAALRAHLNLLEQLPPFAIVVLVGAATRVSTPVTAWCAVLFFWIRVAHAIGYVSGLARAPVRPLLYVSGWIVTLTFAWQVLAHAL